jgi:hypothetical protein
MPNHLIPVLLLVVCITLALGLRPQLFGSRSARWLAGAACVLAVGLSLPYEGLDFVRLKRIKLLLAAATALLLLLRHFRNPRVMKPAVYRGALCALAALSTATYLNFFAYHGGGLFVHLHDVAHYYLGAKYYGQLGNAGLYTAMLRAESEWYGDRFTTTEARDLDRYERVHIGSLLERSDPVKAAFSPERWAEFQRDVSYFREALGPHYAGVLLDHGFNATPVWTLIGRPIARSVSASDGGLFLLALLDPLLIAAMLIAIAWAFGLDAMLLSLIYLCLLFGAGFGWTGGGFLRTPWLVTLVGSVCCLRRQHHAAAGALMAGASLLRIFPIVLAAPLLLRAIAISRRQRQLPPQYRAWLVGFGVTAAALLSLTLLLPRGFDHWVDFRSGMGRYVEVVSPNLVGLTPILAYRGGPDEVGHEEFREIETRRTAIRRVQLWLVVLPLLALFAKAAGRVGEVTACALGIPLLFAGLNLAAYYYAFLLLLVLANSRNPGRLALIFAAEVISYSAMLFEQRDGALHVYRSIVVGLLLLALYAKPLLERWTESAVDEFDPIRGAG